MPVSKATLEHTNDTVHFGWKPATAAQKRRALPFGPFVKRYGGKPPPAKVSYQDKAARSLSQMLGNDQVGDCVIAAELHGIGVWSANEPGGSEAVATTKEALAQYQAICGPGDNGCYIPEVLDHFRDKGMVAAGKARKIEGWVSMSGRDELLVKTALYLLGKLNLGVNWPRDWMTQAKPGGVLKPTNSPILGGHSIAAVGYDDVGLQVATWGFVCTLSWEALASPRWVDECYGSLGEDWYNEKGETAVGAGVNVEALRKALDVIKGGGTPVIPDDPTPPTPPPTPSDATFAGAGAVDFFGQMLALKVAGEVHPAKSGAAQTASVWVILADCAALVSAFRAKDWVAVADAVRKLLADLGVNFGAEDCAKVTQALAHNFETEILVR